MSKIESITSAANPLVKDVRRAILRGGLTDDGWCVAESAHLLEEALRSGREVQVVLISESARCAVNGLRAVVLPDKLFQSIAATETSQGVIALVKPPTWSIEQLFGTHSLVVVLDGLQDPGNAGAIVRTAEAFGATGVMFLKCTVSPHHPKTLRASAGSLFRIPLATGATAADLNRPGLSLYAAMPFTGSQRLAGDVDFKSPCAIVIGSEGRGISPEVLALCEEIAIPTMAVESLNAAAAAAVLLYEARRQRQ
jgi:RNA methyltransferase, TrmH family